MYYNIVIIRYKLIGRLSEKKATKRIKGNVQASHYMYFSTIANNSYVFIRALKLLYIS